MSLIKSLSIRAKLLLLIGPLLAALVVTDVRLLQSMSARITSFSHIEVLVTLTQLNSNLAHEMQKERGMSAGYLGSGGKSFAQAIIKQRQLVDTRRGNMGVCKIGGNRALKILLHLDLSLSLQLWL